MPGTPNPVKRLFQQKQDEKANHDALREFADMAKGFVDDNPEALVLIADPKTDLIFMSYQGITAPIRIVNRDGSRNYIVRNALRHQMGQVDIDRFLLAVDGGLYNIAKVLHSKQRETIKGKILEWTGAGEAPPVESNVKLTDGSTLAPIQLVDKE